MISEDMGRKLDSVTLVDLGRAKKVIVEKENTTIVRVRFPGSCGGRVKQIKAQVEETLPITTRKAAGNALQAFQRCSRDPYRRSHRDEMKEKKARVDDACMPPVRLWRKESFRRWSYLIQAASL
jgi:chaperonin GroEL